MCLAIVRQVGQSQGVFWEHMSLDYKAFFGVHGGAEQVAGVGGGV